MNRFGSLNHVYRLVWSYASNCWIPVAETMRAKGKRSTSVLIAATLPLIAGIVEAGPLGGQVVGGGGSITQSGTTTTIRQTTQDLSLTWKSFDIAPQETVDFVQPSVTSIAVNRIFDVNGTQILGHLNANGQVYLINPNGIVFGKGAQVNVGGLVASTLGLNDTADGATKTFSGSGSGSIVNEGTLNAASGGYVALLANTVSNRGTISAQLGTVALGAGSAATLTFAGNRLMHMQVDQGVLNALAENRGLIRAGGGQVLMTAGAQDALLASVVNNTGVIEASTVEDRGGSIALIGGKAGQVLITGTLDASSATGNGGEIVATGETVLVGEGARVAATGATGGGSIAIGGAWEGGAGVTQATGVYVAKTATLDASATGRGNGGDVVVRSNVNDPDSATRVYGSLLARGGAGGGNGGRIETSGRYLDVSGIAVDSSARSGLAGEWLLDPYNVIIGSSTSGNSLTNGNALTTPSFSPTSSDSTILASDISNALSAGNDVSITTGSSGSSLGDITVNTAIAKTAGGASKLLLQAADSIIINAPISNTSASGILKVNLSADTDGTTAGAGTHDGVGVIILNKSITTNGGYIQFGPNAQMTVNGVANTWVGGDVYVGGTSAVTLSTAGGVVNVYGQLLAATTGGFNINTANGSVLFASFVDSGDSYTYVGNSGISWTSALSAAKSGLGANTGDTYLATITSRLENSVAGATANYNASWLGAQRVTGIGTDAIWRWVSGPEGLQNGGKGLQFFTQNGSATTNGSGGTAIGSSYSNWNPGEPNNSGGSNLSAGGTGENVMQFVGTQGQWNDLAPSSTAVLGYIVETNLTPSALTVNAGTGSVTFAAGIGVTKPLSTLSVTANTIALPSPAIVNTTGAQTFTGQVKVGGNNVSLLTVSADNLVTTYGSGVPALTTTYSGFVNSDTVASLTSPATESTTAPAQPNSGSYPITPSGVVDPNYYILYNPGTLIVNTATLNVTASSATKTYRSANPALTVSYSGLQYSDTASSILTTLATASTSATMASNAGSYATTAAGAVNSSSNYTLAYVPGTLTVNPAPLTVSGLSGTSRAYNGLTADTLTGTAVLSGLQNSETLTLGNATSGTLASANVGSEAVSSALTLVSGTGLASNYSLTQPTLANVTVSPAPLTVSGLSGTSRTYNGLTADALTGTAVLSGLQNSETLTLGNAASGTLASANVGSRAVTSALTLVSGTGLASNYSLTQPTLANVTISPAPLTVSGLSGTSRAYNGLTADTLTGTAVLSGLQNSETLTLGNAASGTLASANVGSEALSSAITLVSGTGLASNYSLTQPTLANVTIAPAPLTVSGLSGTSRAYNGLTADALTGTAVLSGLQNSETLTLGNAASATLASANAGSEAVTSAFTLVSGTGLASNYSLTQPILANVTISPASLTVSGLSGTSRAYNGLTADTLTGTAVLSGLQNSETLTLGNAASGTLASANAGSEAVSTALTLVAGTGSISNYSLTQPTLANVTISPASLTVSGLSGTSRTYNGLTADTLTGTAVLSGLQNSETLTLGNAASGTLASANAGSEAVSTALTLVAGTGSISNYSLAQPTLANVTISPASLTVSGLSGTSRTYNGLTADTLTGTAVLSGLQNSETLTLGNAASGTLASANAGSEAVSTALTLVAGTGSISNYSLAQPTLANVTISPASLTVSGLSGTSRAYNGLTADTLTGTAVLSGLQNSETLTLGNAASGTLASANVGSEALTSALTLVSGTGLASNYSLTQPTLANVTISPASLTISGLSGTSRAYNGLTADALTGTAVLSGLQNSETLTLGNAAVGTLASANAGSEAVSTALTLVAGTGSISNYSLTQPTLANVTISPAQLTVSGLAGTSRAYNGLTADTLTGTGVLSGLQNSETLSLGNAASGTLASANAGSETVSTALTLVAGTGSISNYSLTQPTLANVTISPASLSVSGLSGTSRVYNGLTADALTGTALLSGLQNSETLTLGNAASGTLASANAGSEAVTSALTLVSGTGLASNYSLTQPTLANVTISPAPLTVSGSVANDKIYDRTTVAVLTNGSLNGIVSGDTVTLAQGGSFASRDVGNGIAVTAADTLAGASASNYVLVQPAGLTATITPKQLGLNLSGDPTRVYDATATFGFTGYTSTLLGVIAGDTVSLDTGSVTGYGDKNVGVNKTITFTGFALAGPNAGDYQLQSGVASSTASITPAPISNVVGITANSKIYDGGVGATLNNTGAVFSGEFSGDNLSVATDSGSFAAKNVATGITVNVVGITLGGADALNYALAKTTASTTANITQLASVVWIGPATGGAWSNPANWAGGAIPDLSNVANVVIPTGDTVVFDSAVGGPVHLSTLSSGGLTVSGGTLDVTSALNLTNYSQTGGTLGGPGSFSVLGAFSQSAGQIDMNPGSVTIGQSQGDLSFANIAGGAVNLFSTAGSVILGNLAASSNLAVTAAGGTITQTTGALLNVGGTANLQASSAGAPAGITLTNASNAFVGAVSASGAAISLADAGPLTLGTVAASGNLTLASVGALDLGTTTVGGNLTANSGNGNVTQSGALAVSGTTGITAGTGNIDLSNAANTLAQAVSASGASISIADSGPLTLGTVAASGNLTLASTGALDLGTSTVGGNLTANSGNGNVTQSGALAVNGTTGITAGTGNIDLGNAANALAQAVSASGASISIADAGPLTLGRVTASGNLTLASTGGLDLGTSTVGGNLTANSGNGSVTQSGPLAVAGTTGIVAGTGNIDLSNAANLLAQAVSASGASISLADAGPLTLGTVAASGNLNLASVGALDLGTTTVSGNLTANSGNGSVTQSGPLMVAGTTGIVAGTGTIHLSDPGNTLIGKVTTVGSEVNVVVQPNELTASAAVSTAVAQLEGSMLGSGFDRLQFAKFNESSALIDTSSPTTSDADALGYVTSRIGVNGPILKILHGGVRLPNNAVSADD